MQTNYQITVPLLCRSIIISKCLNSLENANAKEVRWEKSKLNLIALLPTLRDM